MGYVNTPCSQYIPPTAFHCVGAGVNWNNAAGGVAHTICKTGLVLTTAIVTVPVIIPSSPTNQIGAKLTSVEVDYETYINSPDTIRPALYKVTRGADGAAAVAEAVAQTMNLVENTTAVTQDQHKMIVTLTAPAWIDHDEYYLLELSISTTAAAGFDFLGAVANYTYRI
jgi:hypothetical protein